MNPELEERLREFESAKSEIRALLAGLTEDCFQRRPEPRRWSVAECVDHLLSVGEQMIPRMEEAIADARARGRFANGPFRYGALGNWFARAIGGEAVPPRRRFPVPKIYAPHRRTGWTLDSASAAFVVLQDRFADIVRGADGLDLARVKVTSPVSRLLRLSLGLWLRGLAGHQRRHLWQARQVKHTLLASRDG